MPRAIEHRKPGSLPPRAGAASSVWSPFAASRALSSESFLSDHTRLIFFSWASVSSEDGATSILSSTSIHDAALSRSVYSLLSNLRSSDRHSA
ncbi:hypothetical protein BC834DRAFT_897516, partial [Gloeopeniophorella convolvens]